MFDLNKIKITPAYYTEFYPPASEESIKELEEHYGHSLPDSLKEIFTKYNGGGPEAYLVKVYNPEFGLYGERSLDRFYLLNDDKDKPSNLWFYINNFSDVMGKSTIPFAEDAAGNTYYLKWANGQHQVWYLATDELEEPEIELIFNSFDELLESMYFDD